MAIPTQRRQPTMGLVVPEQIIPRNRAPALSNLGGLLGGFGGTLSSAFAPLAGGGQPLRATGERSLVEGLMLAAGPRTRSLLSSTQAPSGFDFVAPAPTPEMISGAQLAAAESLLRSGRRADVDSQADVGAPAVPAAPVSRGLLADARPMPRPDMPEEAGGLLTGRGSSARLRALGKALMSGPSRMPISVGERIISGLAAGEEAVEREEMLEFAKEQRERQKKQIEAQNKLADVLADPESTDAEKKSAFKAAYPVEAFKAEGKPVDLVKAIGAIAIDKLLKEPPEPLSPVEQDAYNKLMSIGGSGGLEELLAIAGLGRDTRSLNAAAKQGVKSEFSTNKEANDAAKAAGESTYVFEGKTYRTQ